MAKPKLGSGGRFKALTNKLKGEKGVYNPGGLAAAIGRKKYGKKKMAKLSAGGRKKKKGPNMKAIVNKRFAKYTKFKK